MFSLKGQSAEITVDLSDGSRENLLDGTAVEVKDGKLFCNGKPMILCMDA